MSSADLLELVRSAREGDSMARDELLTVVRPQLREWAEHALNSRFTGRVDASDLTQVTLLDLHQKLGQFAGASEGEFIDWLRRALDRNILDAVRHATAQKRNVSREEAVDRRGDDGAQERNQLASDTSSPSVRVIRGEEADRLERALETLLPDQKDVVRFVHLEGNSLAQAAEHMNRSPAAVAKLLQRGIKSLRAALNESS